MLAMMERTSDGCDELSIVPYTPDILQWRAPRTSEEAWKSSGRFLRLDGRDHNLMLPVVAKAIGVADAPDAALKRGAS